MATKYGYALSSEEHDPGSLVHAARRAEDGGFAFCSISDHYHPWVEAQGQRKAVEVAARIGDGLWTSGPTSELIDAYLACGGTGSRYGQIHVC